MTGSKARPSLREWRKRAGYRGARWVRLVERRKSGSLSGCVCLGLGIGIKLAKVTKLVWVAKRIAGERG